MILKNSELPTGPKVTDRGAVGKIERGKIERGKIERSVKSSAPRKATTELRAQSVPARAFRRRATPRFHLHEMQSTSLTTGDAKRRAKTLWMEFTVSDYVKTKASSVPSLKNLKAIDEMESVSRLCVQTMYEHFAEWMTMHHVKKRDGQPLTPGTLDSYFGYLMFEARARAVDIARENEKQQVKEFFSCSDGDTNVVTEEVRWFRGVKHNMRRKSIARLT